VGHPSRHRCCHPPELFDERERGRRDSFRQRRVDQHDCRLAAANCSISAHRRILNEIGRKGGLRDRSRGGRGGGPGKSEKGSARRPRTGDG
ncbi:unnamed protein product, partial [Symbiodinium microadriaticum]